MKLSLQNNFIFPEWRYCMYVASINGLSRFTLAVALLLAPFYTAQAEEQKTAPEQIKGVTRVDAEGVIEKVAEITNLIIIDARIRSDRAQGHIEGSLSLPDEDTDCKALKKVIPTKTTPVLFYCNGPKCGRSVISSRVAKKCGYKSIYWFRGGIEEWKKKRYPLVKSSNN